MDEKNLASIFKALKGIPYLSVETGFSNADIGQIITRVSAFIEMM